jgi:TP901 family phage tail tape measure protein
MADERVLIEIEAEDNASSKIDKVSSSIQNLGTSTNNLGRGTGVSEFLKSWERGLHKFNSTMRQYNATMSGINNFTKRILKDAGAAVWDFTTDSVEAYTEFTEQHAKVLGVMANQNEYKITYDDNLDEISAKQQRFLEDANRLKSQSIQLGTYGIDAQGSLMDISSVSVIQEELLKSGVSSQDILSTDIVQQLMKFSIGNDLSTTESVEFAVALGNQFGIKPQDWGDMLDKVAHTADVSVIDVADVVQSMKYAGGITAGLDRPLEETLAEIAILGNFGLKGSQGGTGIQALLTRLLTQDATVITDAQKEIAPKRALKAFYDFSKFAKSDGSGLTYDQIAGAKSYEELGQLSGNLRPMTEIIDQMNEVMLELNDEEQAWFAKKFFGLYQMKAAYGLLSGDETDLQAVIDEITMQSGGTNDNKYSQLLESSYGRKEAFANLIQGIKVDFGERLSPFTDKIYEELTKFLSDPNNYEIDFEELRQALQDSCDLIEEKYGTAIANAVENIGDLSIDLTQVMTELGPDIIEGVTKMLGSATEGDIIGLITDWGEMIDNMHASADELPEDLQGLAHGIANVIDWFGKLTALNVATEIAELISSVLQILTIAGGAIINVAGAVVVNGAGTGGAGGAGGGAIGTGGAGGAGAGAGAKSVLSGESVVGSADDVAKALGTSADDVIRTFGEQASYTIDDIAKGLGASSDDVISAYASSIDDAIAAGAGSIDDVVTGSSKLWGSLSGVGKALGIAGTLAQVGFGAYDAYQDYQEGDYKSMTGDITGTAGSVGGGIAGAKAGGALGTAIVPGIGTGIGIIVGGIAGSLGGDYLFRKAGESVYDKFHYGTTGIGVYDDWKKQQNEDDDYYNKMKETAPILVELGEALEKLNVGSLNAKEWALELARDNGMSEYDKNLSGDDRLTFNSLYKQYMGEGSYDLWQSYYKSGDWQLSAEERLAKSMDLNDLIINITKDNPYYDASLDQRGSGHYSVWAGTDEQYQTWLRGQTFLGDGTHYKGDMDDAYSLDEVSEACKNGIIQGLKEKNNETEGDSYKPVGDYHWHNTGTTDTSKLPNGWAIWNPKVLQNYMMQQTVPNTPQLGLNIFDLKVAASLGGLNTFLQNSLSNMSADQMSVNSTQTTLTGEVQIPSDVWSTAEARVKQNTPGWAAFSTEGMNKMIQNEINNQIQIDDSVTMTPSFNVAAPNVNVNVHVDQAGNATTTKSILNPGLPSILNNYYSRTSKQYATQTKK